MPPQPSQPSPLSISNAILIGQLVINVPVTVILLAGYWIGLKFTPIHWITLLVWLIGFVLAWFWWSFSLPRWRRWAVAKGVPADKLHTAAVKAFLEWPTGWIFEKTEFKVKDK
jgi:hypothetical protein